jgi:hypothetical protein
MNYQDAKIKISETTKKGLDWIGKVLCFGALAMGIYAIGAQANSPQTATTPQAQRTYEVSRLALCESEKSLALSKLKDYSENLMNLAPEDVKRLAEKKDSSCQNSGF